MNKISVDKKYLKYREQFGVFDVSSRILQHNEGLLVHISIPTRGVFSDTVFKTNELNVQFTDTRITYLNEEVVQ